MFDNLLKENSSSFFVTIIKPFKQNQNFNSEKIDHECCDLRTKNNNKNLNKIRKNEAKLYLFIICTISTQQKKERERENEK